jgi:tetratricopeptide (TPR) repeat protein
MSTVVLNVDEEIKKLATEENRELLEEIAGEFKQGFFTNVLSKTSRFRKGFELDDELKHLLDIIDVTSHAQLGEMEEAAKIVEGLFEKTKDDQETIDDLLLYGQLAFMCDYKLARKILSHTRNVMEEQGETGSIRLARCYAILGEAEENLQKFPRAIKYYEKSLEMIETKEEQEREIVVFIYYKLGGLYSSINETKKAIEYLERTLELAEGYNEDIKMNSLVSLAMMHGSEEEEDKVKAYLDQALPLLEQSSLKNKMVHAEAHTEMAYYYFNQSLFDDAVRHYEETSHIYKQLPTYSARKLGMIYMQYAYALENQKNPEKLKAGKTYEKAIEQLEKTNDRDLIESALADVIDFFHTNHQQKKKRYYENKFVELTNDKMPAQ